MKLDNSMLMYGVYNAETLQKSIKTVHGIHNTTSSHERLFAGEHSPSTFRTIYAHSLGLQNYFTNLLLYLRIIQDKYVPLYRELVTQLHTYVSAIKSPGKRIFTKHFHNTNKIARNFNRSQERLQITNPDYDLVIDRLHLYSFMPLITFGIDKNMNLIIQFPIFLQPYTQKPLILYQLETVPVPILDQNIKAQSYTHLQIKKPYIALNLETYISLRQQELRSCKRIGYEF